MANEQNLIPQAHKLTVEDQSKGGKASVSRRREMKTIREILTDYLGQNVNNNQALEKLAKAAGIKGEQSVKELVTAVCILNTLKKGDVDKLEKICTLLGENVSENKNNGILDDLLEYLKDD